MAVSRLNDLIAELRELDRDAPVFDDLINAMLAILDIHKIKPKRTAPNCEICERAKNDECVSGWMPRAYTITTDKSDYDYSIRCANFTIASKLWPAYVTKKSKDK